MHRIQQLTHPVRLSTSILHDRPSPFWMRSAIRSCTRCLGPPAMLMTITHTSQPFSWRNAVSHWSTSSHGQTSRCGVKLSNYCIVWQSLTYVLLTVMVRMAWDVCRFPLEAHAQDVAWSTCEGRHICRALNASTKFVLGLPSIEPTTMLYAEKKPGTLFYALLTCHCGGTQLPTSPHKETAINQRMKLLYAV